MDSEHDRQAPFLQLIQVYGDETLVVLRNVPDDIEE
jgi:hypothetical protein